MDAIKSVTNDELYDILRQNLGLMRALVKEMGEKKLIDATNVQDDYQEACDGIDVYILGKRGIDKSY